MKHTERKITEMPFTSILMESKVTVRMKISKLNCTATEHLHIIEWVRLFSF